MFTNYSQTYAATITTAAGFLAVLVNKFGYTQSDVELVLGLVVGVSGLIWQALHRKAKGDVNAIGFRKA